MGKWYGNWNPIPPADTATGSHWLTMAPHVGSNSESLGWLVRRAARRVDAQMGVKQSRGSALHGFYLRKTKTRTPPTWRVRSTHIWQPRRAVWFPVGLGKPDPEIPKAVYVACFL